MLWIKALHIISMILWFSGLFYLPRLFVYHAMPSDAETHARFKIMERKLYFYVMNIGALFTFIFGSTLLYLNFENDIHARWMQLKLGLVLLLLAYHFYLAHLLQQFQKNQNKHSARFYRWINEIPNFFLIAIVILVVVKPQLL